VTHKRRSLSDDERTLWNTVTRAIKPLLRRPREAADEIASAVETVPAKPSRAAASKPVLPAAPAPRRSGPPPLAPFGRRMKQKLGRGTEPIDARIDLHGMTQADAHAALAHFLRRAQRDGARVVLVITGKGVRPGTDPHAERGVLKRQVPHWLESAELRSFVVGFESAGIGHGGAGALYVRVRRGRE
jgi:DNA-nicking Smr family endonuclease